ncbi:MAG: NB-ARC domain-containing protein, partial [Blastocatellia bacterium]
MARIMLPLMGLAGVEGENIRWLNRWMPVAVTLLIGSIAGIVLDLRRQSKYVDFRPKRIVDEAEEWGEDYRFGDYSPEKALGWQSLSDDKPAVEVGRKEVVQDAGVAAARYHPQPFERAVAPELERQIEQVFRDPYETSLMSDARDNASGVSRPEIAGDQTPYAAHTEELADLRNEAETGPRRITLDLLPANEPAEFVSSSDAEGDDFVPAASKTISNEVIAHYQQLIESANLPVITLYQLPPLPPEFSGRSLELEDLLAAHADRELRVLGLQGQGGVGKTTLAVKLAEQLKAGYADAQFYIDLKGAGAQPLSVAEAQSHIIRAYLPTVRLPESEAELHQLYRSLLGDKRAIVLLDNAATTQQVTPLIAPGGCLTIVTSRQHLSLPNSFLRNLEGLPEAEARDLLLKLMPRIGNHAERVAELCGHLPLALRLAVGALIGNPALLIEDYLEKLEDWQTAARSAGLPVRPVDSVLKLSYEQLPPGLQKLWRMLAVFSDAFDLPAAAAVWKLPLVRASVAYDRLLAAGMIERNRATGRIRLHDLMAAFADARLRDDERAVARQRHAAHYQSVLHEADALYEQGGDLMKLGVDLVDLEWQNVQAGQVWAASAMDADRAARELCNSFPDAGKYVLDLRQHPRERIRWSEAALEAAKKMNRDKAAARHLIGLGDSYTALSEVHHAIEFYQQALASTRR